MYTDEQILEYRRTWIEYLKRPETKKGVRKLESFDDPEARCCLGHGCFALGIERTVTKYGIVYYDGRSSYAPQSFMDMVGLYDENGFFSNGFFSNGKRTLTSINDGTDKTPQEIGIMLEEMIMGGDGTPFVKIEPNS